MSNVMSQLESMLPYFIVGGGINVLFSEDKETFCLRKDGRIEEIKSGKVFNTAFDAAASVERPYDMDAVTWDCDEDGYYPDFGITPRSKTFRDMVEAVLLDVPTEMLPTVDKWPSAKSVVEDWITRDGFECHANWPIMNSKGEYTTE